MLKGAKRANGNCRVVKGAILIDVIHRDKAEKNPNEKLKSMLSTEVQSSLEHELELHMLEKEKGFLDAKVSSSRKNRHQNEGSKDSKLHLKIPQKSASKSSVKTLQSKKVHENLYFKCFISIFHCLIYTYFFC